ncbi:MAG: UDP-N-acetylmuramoyl-L-alanyl-D-glutamate--2,6-diaminopimelate ligase, partial [Bradyrhizobium sp.]|nr:UDP-N-acetylmuramoyl-L-alanyl-D-glutamate--2,6-diaminopimelate ligase [Bradyrhizobium sp.]
MKLAELIDQDGEFDAGVAAVEVTGVASDSRKVRPGDLFVAVPGTKADGLGFVRQALAAGAVAVMAERQPESLPVGVTFVRTGNVRRALALAAARFYARQPQTIAAVTGTSGKTSVAAFTRQIWAALGNEAASIGTIGLVTPKQETYGSLTTPDPIELARTLDRLAEDGITHLAMEASSHGLDQHRIDGVRVSVGGFTNLTRD